MGEEAALSAQHPVHGCLLVRPEGGQEAGNRRERGERRWVRVKGRTREVRGRWSDSCRGGEGSRGREGTPSAIGKRMKWRTWELVQGRPIHDAVVRGLEEGGCLIDTNIQCLDTQAPTYALSRWASDWSLGHVSPAAETLSVST